MEETNFALGARNRTTRMLRLIITLASSFLLFQFVSLYLNWPKQIIVGCVTIALAIVLNRTSSTRIVTISLMLISVAATLRYGWWRVHMILQFFGDESNNRLTIDSLLMLVLLSAEAYTILIMLLGFMQTSWPLHRKPHPLPTDDSLWPHVDVLIPTYNEPLSLVRYTALAAVNIDYPPEKLHVHILDDGTRDSFREFAEEAGIGYITRKEHTHAKAGNINHALSLMNSPLVTIFDCDHVPTRSFLQVTVGWFLRDNNLAMLQTPHYFYSPDPFERNLLQYKSIPNEGELFYGVIQDGNDLWNATFFCGSCAVIRREALNDVGGIAVETVTEDAHTSLRMQKKGWNTAYINLRQAAGLATETLSAHVGQRVRWARGMVQIFRTDNPLLARGMKMTQRLCYFNAMLHFLYAVPRLIFLLAPLVYMLAGRTIIPGYWVEILAYALPHLILSSLTNSRVQGKHRHSFWNEIYETVLAPYILLPTFLALINPKLGSFNVTDKGNTLAETKFDRNIAAPTTFLLALNVIGVCVAPYRLLVSDPGHFGTVISNLIWILFNMVILGVAAAVANEHQQRRSSVRIPLHIPARISVPSLTPGVDELVIEGITRDMSVGGVALTVDQESNLSTGTRVCISFPSQTGKETISAAVAQHSGSLMRLTFPDLPLSEQETLTRVLYSRANSWISSQDGIETDRPLVSLLRVIRLSFTGFHQVLRAAFWSKKQKRTVSKRAGIAAAAICLAAYLGGTRATAQIPGSQPPPGSISTASPAADQTIHLTATSPTSAGPAMPSQPGVTLLAPETPTVIFSAANEKISLKDMGVDSALELRGPRSTQSVGFVLSHGLVPRQAVLNLSYRFNVSPTGSIRVLLNQTPIAILTGSAAQGMRETYTSATLPLPADLLIRRNQLAFEFSGGTGTEQARSLVLANIGASSTVLVAGDRIPFKNDLSLLPLPIFDSELPSTTTIPFVFLSAPTPGTLQAAGVVASWFGTLASAKPVHFAVSVRQIPAGNVVIFTTRPRSAPVSLGLQGGPMLSLRTNPSDPNGSALVLSADDETQLLNVARALALMNVAHPQDGESVPSLGTETRIGDFPLPPVRSPDDAPRWLTTDLPISMWNLSSREALKSDGSRMMPVYLRVAPDLFYGESQNVELTIEYRYNARAVAPGSALRIYANGFLLPEIPLPPGTDYADHKRTILLPVDSIRPFGNTLQFSFDFIPAPGGGNLRGQVGGAILQNSYLNLRGFSHWVTLPNLELFANAGFPFTRRADLADTTVVMPAAPTPGEIVLLLTLLSHCGTQTGYPGLRVEVADKQVDGRDLLIIGNGDDQPAFSSLADALPVLLDSTGVHVKQRSGALASLQTWLAGLSGDRRGDTPIGDYLPDVLIEGIESPLANGHSIVALMLRDDAAADEFAQVFLERSQSSDIAQTVSLLHGGRFSSYRVDTPQYDVGTISKYARMRIWFAQHFWLLLVVVTGLSLVLARFVRDYLALLSEARLKDETPLEQEEEEALV